MSKRAVVVIDLQKEYLPSGKLPLVGIDAALANAAKVIGAARAKGDLVIHVRHESPTADAPFFVRGTDGVEICPEVQPVARERVIVKNFPNSFRDTELRQALDAEAVDQVVVVGAMSHMCIAATSRAAAELGYDTLVVDDACATCDLEFKGQRVPAAQVHAANMAALAAGYGRVVETEELLSR